MNPVNLVKKLEHRVIQLSNKLKTILDRIKSLEEDLEDSKNSQSTHLPKKIKSVVPSLDNSKSAALQPKPAVTRCSSFLEDNCSPQRHRGTENNFGTELLHKAADVCR